MRLISGESQEELDQTGRSAEEKLTEMFERTAVMKQWITPSKTTANQNAFAKQ
jgi:hypothetical protein